MIEFREKEIEKLSAITSLTPMQVQNLLAMGLIDDSKALDTLILYDFRRIKRRRLYRVGQIIEALVEKYKTCPSRVQRVIYHKKKKIYYCNNCAKQIKAREHHRNNGRCDHCVAMDIEI